MWPSSYFLTPYAIGPPNKLLEPTAGRPSQIKACGGGRRRLNGTSLGGMSLAVFEIEFPEHLPEQKRRYWSDQLRDAGATVEEAADDRRRVVCEEPKVHHHVGWILFHTAIAKYGRVVATEGAAQAQASAYPKPPSRR